MIRPYVKILAMKTKNQSIITLENMKGAIRKELIKADRIKLRIRPQPKLGLVKENLAIEGK